MKRPLPIILASLLLLMAVGTWRDDEFWLTADQQGDFLMHRQRFAEAAQTYRDPLRIGVAQYRDGQFEAAAKTFARVPGTTGLYNAGNAWLMHGQYERAITAYDHAIRLRPGWLDAAENKAIAKARLGTLQQAGKDRSQESADAFDPDDIAFDAKGSHDGKPAEPANGTVSNETLQAAWLRRVKTTPAQFLKAKFAWQAQSASTP